MDSGRDNESYRRTLLGKPSYGFDSRPNAKVDQHQPVFGREINFFYVYIGKKAGVGLPFFMPF